MNPRSLFAVASASILSVFAVGCSGAASDTGTSEEDVTGTTYVDAVDFNGSVEQDAMSDLAGRLGSEFNDVCGDTFCEGDYSNLSSLGFSCSVSSVKGSVHECMWTFAGSLAAIDPKTGAVSSSIPTYQCAFSPKGTIGSLVTALNPASPARAIDVILPGTSTSLYDGLVDCFQKPIGATKLTFGDETGAKYVDANDGLTGGTLTHWRTATNALANGFYNICGDTFCGSDYGNLTPLSFSCSVTPKSGSLGTCKWLFAGSYNSITATTGRISVNAKTFACDVPVKGVASATASVINAPGSDNPIQRDLPGEMMSPYDAIGNGCLP